MALKRAVCESETERSALLATGVFGDSLCAFADGVLSQFTGQQQTDGSLDFTRADGRFLVVVGKTRGLSGDTFEDIVDEGVHDAHGLAGNASVRVHLFEHFVHVDGVTLLS